MNANLNKLHECLKNIMLEVHSICINNDIKYTLIGGSLIGAIRHQGFIPWDDDMDIGMTWSNYQKFIAVIKKNTHEWLEFDIPGCRPDYYQTFIKAYDSRTTFVEEQHTVKQARGVFVDIMPVSFVGNSYYSAVMNFKYHKLLLAFYRRKGYNLGKNMIKESLFKLIGNLFSNETWIRLVNAHYKHLNKTQTLFVSDMDGNTNGIVDQALFHNYINIKFEDCSFMIISQYDKYLSHVFGDYMQLPPIEKRIPHHIIYINFDESYREYLNRI